MEVLELLLFGSVLLTFGLGFLTPWLVFYLVKRRTRSWWRAAGACVFVSPVAAFLIGGMCCALPWLPRAFRGDVWSVGDWFLAGGNAGVVSAGLGFFLLLSYGVIFFVGRTVNHREDLPASPFFPPVTSEPPDERKPQCNL